MTSAIFTATPFWERFEIFCKALAASQTHTPPQGSMLDDSRVKRDFLFEILESNPHAFQGETDILNMAHLYLSKY